MRPTFSSILKIRYAILCVVVVLAYGWASTIPDAEPNRPTTLAEMLQMGAQNGNVSMIRQALAKGVDVETNDVVHLTQLMLAARSGRIEAVRYLISQGAKLNSVAPTFCTPLMLAALNGHKDVIRELLRCGADPNVSLDGKTAVWNVVLSGDSDAESVSLLIEAGADVDLASAGGQSLVAAARQEDRSEILQVLLQAGPRDSLTSVSGASTTRLSHFR